MTSRRLIRVKVLQILYSYMNKENVSLEEIERDLLKSIEKSTDLYFLLFLLITEIRQKSFFKADSAKHKYLPTEQERNPNTRFIDNPVFSLIENNRTFKKNIKDRLLSWNDYPEIISHIYQEFTTSEPYRAYMAKETVNFDDHKQIILHLFEYITQNEAFLQVLEDRNIFWNDDFELIFNLAYKTLKSIKSDTGEETNIFLQIYKNEEDIDFARTLLMKSILEYDFGMEIINRFIQNWEIDRLSNIDKYIMLLALSEFQHFPSIPVKVTLDEYIEIAKSYSSAKSSGFINGVLDKAVLFLKEQGKIQKIGRGLME